MVRGTVLQKIVQERKFPELTAGKAKLIIKTISTRNFAELIKSKGRGAGINGINVTNLFWLKQALSFLRGFCSSRSSVSTCVKQTYQYNFSIKGHIFYVYVCVCKIPYYYDLGVAYLTVV